MPRKKSPPDLIFEGALNAFIASEGVTLLAGVSERNTCGRLSIYLERQMLADGLRGYYADIEYNRKQQGRVKTIINDQEEVIQITPDLIVHSRGEKPAPHDNLIAVEMKKASRSMREKNADRARLQAMTRMPYDGVWSWEGSHPEHVCGYALGVYVEIDVLQRQLRLEFYERGSKTEQKRISLKSIRTANGNTRSQCHRFMAPRMPVRTCVTAPSAVTAP